MRESYKRELKIPIRQHLETRASTKSEAEIWAGVQARREQRGHSEPPRTGQHLPAPVSRVLVGGDDFALERSRLWRDIAARRYAPGSGSGARISVLAVGALALAAALVLGVLVRPGARNVASNGVLTQRDGQPVVAQEATAQPKVIALADASEIRLAPGSRIEPLAASDTRFEVLLARGEAEFSVTPGGPRRWVVHAGLARVEVVGTVFRVERKAHKVRVSVSRGAVVVRGDSLPGGLERLTAGQAVTVGAESRVQAPSITAGVVQPVHPASPAESAADETRHEPQASSDSVLSRTAKARPRSSWQRDLAVGRYAAAYDALGKQGLAREIKHAKSVDALLALADVARLSGHPSDAVVPLTRVLDEFNHSPHAALAAFTLGRVLLDQLGSPAAAAAAFERAIAMRPPHALLADCHGRLVEAYARSGDTEGAARATARYRALFPNGRHVGDLEDKTNP